MTYSEIEYEVDKRMVATVTLNNPQKHNALSVNMMRELIDAFSQIGKNERVRLVVLSGKGRSFCAGADLAWMQSNLDKSREQRIAESMRLAELLDAISQCNKLVIAAVNGSSFAGGIGLMSACDIVISVDTAKFALTETKLGLVPANIAPMVLRRIGQAGFRRIALNAATLSAATAEKMGLVDEVAAIEEFAMAVEVEVSNALNCAPNAISEAKEMLMHLESGELNSPTDYLVGKLADAWEHDEAQQGIRAFFAKQSPPWKIPN